jgi:hypothetical protein
VTVPDVGTFVLHSQVKPPITAGDYVLHGEQQVAGGAVAPYDGHVRISSPRFTLPPDQLLSTFPPANAEGAFSSRLPQIVMRRRTLPWERLAAADHPDTPWLALVVIAEGEGTLSGETPVGQCVTPGVTLTGPSDVATSVYLGVTKTVVDAVFPTADDLSLLAHVREVDINDTELAMGDDDGWLAVVLANRLPQPGKRYVACLINLEGQLDVLPVPKPQNWLDDVFDAQLVVQDLRVAGQIDPDAYVMGQVPRLGAGGFGLAAGGLGAGGAAGAPAVSAPGARVSAAAWEAAPQRVEEIAVSASAEEASRLVRDGMTAGWRIPIDAIAIEPTYRFPVLQSWSFTCSEAGDFEALMQNLDVGLLGTPPQTAAPDPAAPAPPPPTRPAPEVAETGHIGLQHLTRRGETATAWFRGPLTPRLTEREQPGADGRLPLAHDSDQLRRVVPDGREDLAYSAAFEIGRLLALSQPSVVAALLRWRQERFGADRAHRFVGSIVGETGILAKALGDAGLPVSALGDALARGMLAGAAEAPSKVFGPRRALADPGPPVKASDDVLAAGLGVDLGALRKRGQVLGAAGALGATPVPVAPLRTDGPLLEGPDLDHLRGALTAETDRIASQVFVGRIPQGPVDRPGLAAETERPRDALDDLIDRASGEEGR